MKTFKIQTIESLLQIFTLFYFCKLEYFIITNIFSNDTKRYSWWRGKYHCTIDLLFDWFGISSMTTDNFCSYLQNRLIKTSKTGGQWYSDTSPFSIPWFSVCQTMKVMFTLGYQKRSSLLQKCINYWSKKYSTTLLGFQTINSLWISDPNISWMS